APRREFFAKELELVVSCSYGPGRYDADYEERGRDYPYGYVRWTEQRNIEAVLDQMATGRLDVSPLTTHRFGLERALDAYRLIETGFEPYVGIVLVYPEQRRAVRRIELPQDEPASRPSKKPTDAAPVRLSFIGAGGFASSTLLPAFAADGGYAFAGIASAKGLSGRGLGRKHRFRYAAADADEVLADELADAVVVATRHELHAPLGLDVLRAGKHLFLEKPLAIDEDQLEDWVQALDDLGPNCPVWTVGFNRRFSPAVKMLKDAFQGATGPKNVTLRMNVGALPADHWTHDPESGGGRVIGEACHAVDLAVFLTGAVPVKVYAQATAAHGAGPALDDDVVVSLRHADGSVSTVIYASGGDRAAGKERVEMFGGGVTAVLDDFRSLTVHRGGRRVVKKAWWTQQKGFAEEVAAFKSAVRSGVPPIPYRELLATTAATLRAVQSLRLDLPLEVD
ncbi:MAG: Gfo/Idh/MocA family oxidoreductase, partial [Planctomycetia bacterium]